MLIDPFIALHSICFCVFLCGDGDEVEIVSDMKTNNGKGGRNNEIVIDSDEEDESYLNGKSEGNQIEIPKFGVWKIW